MEEIIVNPEEISIDNNPRTKFKRILIGAFILLLIIYFVFGGVWGNLIGMLQSSSLDEDRIDLFDVELIFLEDTYADLLSVYYDNLGLEFKACLLGSIEGDYYVDKVFIPEMYIQSPNHVSSAPCPEGTIVDLHSHPDKHCLFSEVDRNSFEKTRSEGEVMALMCGEERFNFYR
jgi:hypothetical protein